MRKRQDSWGPAEEVLLTELWNGDKQSAREIGLVMNRTRNEVIGKARRMGLNRKNRSPTGRPARSPAAKKKTWGWGRIQPAMVRALDLPPELVISPIPGGVHILDLDRDHKQCRAIVGRGEDGLARYCGASVFKRPRLIRRGEIALTPSGTPIMETTSWCEGHARIYRSP